MKDHEIEMHIKEHNLKFLDKHMVDGVHPIYLHAKNAVYSPKLKNFYIKTDSLDLHKQYYPVFLISAKIYPRWVDGQYRSFGKVFRKASDFKPGIFSAFPDGQNIQHGGGSLYYSDDLRETLYVYIDGQQVNK